MDDTRASEAQSLILASVVVAGYFFLNYFISPSYDLLGCLESCFATKKDA